MPPRLYASSSVALSQLSNCRLPWVPSGVRLTVSKARFSCREMRDGTDCCGGRHDSVFQRAVPSVPSSHCMTPSTRSADDLSSNALLALELILKSERRRISAETTMPILKPLCSIHSCLSFFTDATSHNNRQRHPTSHHHENKHRSISRHGHSRGKGPGPCQSAWCLGRN